ncbi:hypothetical protein BT96DRAFT_620070 [Gymnopus androsaceus JB14]|uniref:Uncharacterized protein n=1 Tax=Gymnopus androsaceus JB14 TaxID=1447944 RepID=A0A6A4HVL8_9AGAR|nr:hypothetical protein BT96DRAFT_620070 [Gymnopus androsaceus JB14]
MRFSNHVTETHRVQMRTFERHRSSDSFYNTRIRIHLQQIQVVWTLHLAYSYSSHHMIFQRSFWLARLYNAIFPPSHVLGTRATADFLQIPEFPKAVKIIQQWVRDAVYQRIFNPPNTFLSDLTRLGTLAMVFDRPYALSQSLLRRGRYAFLACPPIFVRPGSDQVVFEIIGLLEADVDSNPNYLVAGILSLKHIMLHPVPIEINLLCNLLEKICRSLVLAIACQRDDKIHNVTLPRSWLMRPISVEAERRRQVSMLGTLVSGPIRNLLDQIYSRQFADHLLYENTTIAKVPRRVGTIFISRICRAICLLGYNVGDSDLRSKIYEDITYLRKTEPNVVFPATYRSYIEARSWDDLAFAVRNSTKNSAMDEMVNIVHKNRYNSSRPHPRVVRLVVYDKIEDLPKLLTGSIPPVVPSPNAPPSRAIPRILRALSGHAQPLPPSLSYVVPNTVGAETGTAVTTVVEADPGTANDADMEPEEEQIEDVAPQAIPFSIIGPLLDQPDIPEPTEDEHRNATIIQLAYRKYWSHKGNRQTQVAVSRDKWFYDCLKMDSIKPGRYRKMMLGPLPHILVGLELIYMGTQESKSNTKKRTRLPLKSEELDLLDKQLTQTNSAIKKVTKWKKILEPPSLDLHRGQDCLQLRSVVREIQEFIENELPQLPVKLTPDTKAEFDMGFRGIAQESASPKAVPTKPPKPELNTEDVNDFF